MALVRSLLTAIARADGDALVMHVGEKPYVVASAGPIELSTQSMNLQAMSGMLAQLLPLEMQRALTEFGAVEHELPSMPGTNGDRFTVVAARGGDDVWIELRRHRRMHTAESIGDVTAPNEQAAPSTVCEGTSEETRPQVAITAEAALHFATHTGPAPDAPPAADATPASLAERSDEMISHSEETRAAGVVDMPSAEALSPELPSVEVGRSAAVAGAGALQTDRPQDAAPASEHAQAENDQPAASAPDVVPSRHEPPAFPVYSESSAAATSGPNVTRRPAMQIPIVACGHEASTERAIDTALPMTRTVRIEVPPAGATRQPAAVSTIERLLKMAALRGATALHLTTDAPPFLRIDAEMRALEGEPALPASAIENAVRQLFPEKPDGAQPDAEDPVLDIPGVGRVRCSTFRDVRGPGAIFQFVWVRPQTAEQLGLSAEIQALATETEGLVVLAGPRGQGRTTLAGAFVDLINRQRSCYVVTLEREVRIAHEHRSALVSQREMPAGPDAAVAMARAALREDPDVLVIDEVTSPEMAELALDAAGKGLLVVMTMTADSTASALAQLVDLFPVEQREAVQTQLAERLRGAVAQMLLRRTSGGRVAAREVLPMTSRIADLVRAGAFAQVPEVLAGPAPDAPPTLIGALVRLVREGSVDLRDVVRRVESRGELIQALRDAQIDTGPVERFV